MFYLLNFENHQFISCNNASVAEAKIRNLLASGCAKESLEIINGFVDESRMPVDAFRAFCAEQGLIDNNIVDFLIRKEQGREMATMPVQAEDPTIDLWARLGVSLSITPGELAVLKGGDAQKAKDLLVDLVRSDRCAMSGETYFPAETNEEFLGDVEGELEFQLDGALHGGAPAPASNLPPALDDTIAMARAEASISNHGKTVPLSKDAR